MKPEIHEFCLLASVPLACLNGIDVHTSSSIAEHEFLWSSILLEHHQFLKDDVVHWNGSSPTSPTSGDENRPSKKVHVFPLKPENLAAPHARVKSDGNNRADVISPTARGGSADSTPINPAALAAEPNVTFTALGTRVIDGHDCLKIEAACKGKPEKFYFYAARDLKNPVIVAQMVEPKRNTLQTLGNISLAVPDDLVQIPPDYKPIEHDRWVKLENAKVTYGGKTSKDFFVFRAPEGQLFIRVNDAPYPWDYLVRPKEATVETAFQGLIVTRRRIHLADKRERGL